MDVLDPLATWDACDSLLSLDLPTACRHANSANSMATVGDDKGTQAVLSHFQGLRPSSLLFLVFLALRIAPSLTASPASVSS